MPEQTNIKFRPRVALPMDPPHHSAQTRYAELQVTTNFSFLRGGSHPEEFVAAAAHAGCHAVAVTDLNSLAGVVRAHEVAKEAGVRLVIGCHVALGEAPPAQPRPLRQARGTSARSRPKQPEQHDAPPALFRELPLHLLLYPANRSAYGRLSRLLTTGKRRTEKGYCLLTLPDILESQEDLLAVLLPPPPPLMTDDFHAAARLLRETFTDDRLSVAASCLYDGNDETRLAALAEFARKLNAPLAATNDVHYHVPERRPLQDVLTCIRLGCTLDEAGFAFFANAERHIKGPDEMARLFRHYPAAIARTVEIADRACFSLNELKYEYPAEVCPPGKTMMEHLIDRTWAGARERYAHLLSAEIGNKPQRAQRTQRNDDENKLDEFRRPSSVPSVVKNPPANENDLTHPDHPANAHIPQDIKHRLHHEFALIQELNYPAYFLTVNDIVAFARSKGILCQGRGAAANSAVCYCLGITSVDPNRIDLLVERFISKERGEPPDIDIDFEHERREEVIQYLYAKYGRDRAALTAEVISYRRRSAIREVGKALGLSLDCVDRLAKSGDWWENEVIAETRLRELGLDPADRTLRQAITLAGELIGFPRHLSQHVGGFVISREPLCEIVPVENAAMEDRTVIEWDKDDIEAMGMLKVDVLGLGMLTCIRKALDLVNDWNSDEGEGVAQAVSPRNNAKLFTSFSLTKEQSHGQSAHIVDDYLQTATKGTPASLFPSPSSLRLQFHTVPPDDSAVYDMLCKADSIGVFQVESRAQMTMLPRLKPRCYYDLVIEVAIVRPGPIQGGMVHPYLRRRMNVEKVEYPSPAVEQVLKRTLGVPIFQEQAMRLVMVAAGFTAGEADQLRRAMAAWKKKGHIMEKFAKKIVEGMRTNGYSHAYALRVVEQIKGFSDYGFPESHAASFALLVYVSAWLKCHHPAAFAAALINSQPMGFYQPAQIVRDARDHGVEVLPIDINFSTWDCTLEPLPIADCQLPICADPEPIRQLEIGNRQSPPALRLGIRLSSSLREADANKIAEAVKKHGPFNTLLSLWRTSGVRVEALRQLAAADAFTSMGLDRQQALWATQQLKDDALPMFEDLEIVEQSASLPEIALQTRVVYDYAATGLSLKAHPVAFVRDYLTSRNVTPCGNLADEKRYPHGKRVSVAGLVLVRQRPGTASGILFMTMEDETGVANLVVRPDIYDQYRAVLRHSIGLIAHGTVERQGQVIHVFVHSAERLTRADQVGPVSRDFH